MSRCERLNVYAVAIYYWSRSTPTHLHRGWKRHPTCVESAYGAFTMATFNSKQDAEAEAVAFVAAHPKYLGCVRAEAVVTSGNVTFRE